MVSSQSFSSHDILSKYILVKSISSQTIKATSKNGDKAMGGKQGRNELHTW